MAHRLWLWACADVACGAFRPWGRVRAKARARILAQILAEILVEILAEILALLRVQMQAQYSAQLALLSLPRVARAACGRGVQRVLCPLTAFQASRPDRCRPVRAHSR